MPPSVCVVPLSSSRVSPALVKRSTLPGANWLSCVVETMPRTAGAAMIKSPGMATAPPVLERMSWPFDAIVVVPE